jgi:hypothetical protein
MAPKRPSISRDYTDEAIVQPAIVDGGLAFLQKPVTPAPLTRKISQLLGTKTDGG